MNRAREKDSATEDAPRKSGEIDAENRKLQLFSAFQFVSTMFDMLYQMSMYEHINRPMNICGRNNLAITETHNDRIFTVLSSCSCHVINRVTKSTLVIIRIGLHYTYEMH
jgi:hypothetical protein